MAAKVYKGDVGTLIVLDTETDLTGATVTSVRYKKPDGNKGTWDGSIVSADSGATNGVGYTSVDGDFDKSGKWILQPYVELPTGKWRGASVTMVVYDEFE